MFRLFKYFTSPFFGQQSYFLHLGRRSCSVSRFVTRQVLIEHLPGPVETLPPRALHDGGAVFCNYSVVAAAECSLYKGSAIIIEEAK
jgi:hypothetical protein